MSDIPVYVLDTSALITFTDNEPGAEVVADLLHQARGNQAELLISGSQRS